MENVRKDLGRMSTSSVQVDSALVTWALGAMGAVVFFLVSLLLRIGYRDMKEKIEEISELKDEIVALKIKLAQLQSDHEREIAILGSEIVRLEERLQYVLTKS